MDPRVAGAGIAMALGMMLLLPTFNALNNSFVEDVAPPPWFPTPDEIPENFKPPEDYEPPEGYEPPPDMEPPPGWEPPPGYEGPIPPGGCPPPLIQPVKSWNRNGTMESSPQQVLGEWRFSMPRYTYAFGGYVNFTQWQATSVSYEILDPNGTKVAEDTAESSGGGLLLSPTPQDTSFQYDSREDGEFPAPGNYTLRLLSRFPISGQYQTDFVYAVPCGGLLK